jgi:integrase/recombinase XerC
MELTKPNYNSYAIDRSKYMTPEEAKHLLKTCADMAELDLLHGRRTWVTRSMFVSLLLRTGLRIGEAAALKIGDIHLSNTDSYLVVMKGKGGKRRDVYISASLKQSLKKYLECLKRWNEPHGPDDHLLSHHGKQYTTTALDYSFREALKKAGLPVGGWKTQSDGRKLPPWKGGQKIEGHHPHSARHTYATCLLADTGDLRGVQKQLGHSSLTMTSLYADLLPARRQEIADRLSL